ncbi:MAG: hypothetical protein IKP66_04975, partial [Lachnospiraceae bacterium]|nr:hypothetical protein [Lachnospiraceae bacterium]
MYGDSIEDSEVHNEIRNIYMLETDNNVYRTPSDSTMYAIKQKVANRITYKVEGEDKNLSISENKDLPRLINIGSSIKIDKDKLPKRRNYKFKGYVLDKEDDGILLDEGKKGIEDDTIDSLNIESNSEDDIEVLTRWEGKEFKV